MIYLDYAATSPLSPSVIGQLDGISQTWMNPSSVYTGATYNRDVIENVRNKVAKEINADPEEIIFTSGGSESNALAIKGFLDAHPQICFAPSAIEHTSVLGWFDNVLRQDKTIPVGRDGVIDLEFVENMKPNKNKEFQRYLISVCMVNNEIGTVEPIKELVEIAHKNNHIVHVDAVQAFGKMPIDVKELDVDMMSISGHKIGSIEGVGVLYVKKDVRLATQIQGTQESGKRGGTYNHLAIKSLGLALDDIDYSQSDAIRAKRNFLMNLLLENPHIRLNGDVSHRNDNNINICIRDIRIDAHSIVELMNQYGFLISAGSACHSGSNYPSHVLKAIGLNDEDALHSIRITIGYETSVRDLEAFADRLFNLIDLYKK